MSARSGPISAARFASAETEATKFVPALVETALPARAADERQQKRRRQVARSSGIIEVEIDGVTVRIGRGAEVKTVAAVLRALKGSA